MALLRLASQGFKVPTSTTATIRAATKGATRQASSATAGRAGTEVSCWASVGSNAPATAQGHVVWCRDSRKALPRPERRVDAGGGMERHDLCPKFVC